MAIKFSPEMKKKVDELGIKEEEILYMTITRDPLRRILNGTKKVEFRELTDYWLKKFNNYNPDKSFKSEKPIKYLLLQNGTDPGVPRVLIETGNPREKWAADSKAPAEFIFGVKQKCTIEESKKRFSHIYEQAKIEGFTDEDEWLALELGNIIHSENLDVLHQDTPKSKR